MLKQKKKTTLIEMMTSLVVIIITVLGLVIYVSIASRVGALIGASQEQNINREIKSIKSELLSYINVMEIILKDAASTPIVTQAVMQPEYTLGNLQDYIDELRILNKRYDFTLVDYRGESIYTNDVGSDKSYSDELWVKEIIDETRTSYKGASLIGDAYYWTLAVPVKYNNLIEGLLIAEIPIDEVFIYNDMGKRLNGVQIQIIKDNKSILSTDSIENGWLVKESLPEIGVALDFVVDQTENQKMLDSLKRNLLFILIAFVLLAALILIVVSKRFIIEPITDLKEIINNFMTKGIIPEEINAVALLEIEQLTHQYVDMSRIIDQREADLKISELNLRKKNETLENLVLELESTQSMVVQQEKLASIGRLAAGVAHELNSPLGFVNGNFDVLKEYFPILNAYISYLKTGDGKENIDIEEIDYILEDIPQLLDESEEGFSRVIDIVKNLKAYSRIDKVKNDAYDLNKGIKTTLMVARNEYKYIARIEEDLQPLQDIRANGSEINEVLLNIIVNASQTLSNYVTEDEKVILLKTYDDDKYVYCAISDNGPGIDQDIINKIFDPFFTTKGPGQGTGLGLNIAYNIINNKHNGDLSVISELDVGTTFTIKLPK